MRRIKAKHSIIILIIILGLSITIRRTCERFYFGNKESCIYYNDCKIKSEKDNYEYITKKGTNEAGNTDISFKFTGMDTLWNITSTEAVDVILKYDSIIEEGDFKVVIINPDNSIREILDNTDKGEITCPIQSGKTRVKIVGHKVSGSLKLTLCRCDVGDCLEVFSELV